MTGENDERGHWDGLDRFLEATSASDVERGARRSGFPWSRKPRHAAEDGAQEQPAPDLRAAAETWSYHGAWSDEAGDPADHLRAEAEDEAPAEQPAEELEEEPAQPPEEEPAQPPAEQQRPAEEAPTAPGRHAAVEESFDEWVPPWARLTTAALPELLYPEQERSLGRFAYADTDGEQLPDPEAFEPGLGEAQLRGALEAILMVVNEPASSAVLAQVLEEPSGRIEELLRSLRDEYARAGRGFELRHVAGGWRFYTRGEYASFVERFVLDGQQIRLTQAALETLAVIAYKQPVTRSRVAAIRGVNCDGVIKTLVTRGLVEEAGQEPESGAHLYRTTSLFLEKLGINSVDELPPIAPFLPDNVDELDLAQK